MSQNPPVSKDVRQEFKQFWESYDASLESMLCNSEASGITDDEMKEIFLYLPSLNSLRILELGAGIGRITTKFAAEASHVTAVDFIESYINENKRVNEHHKNIEFIHGDATKVDYQAESFDLVFINWLFMYLSQDESEDLMKKILMWLKPSGSLFFRESCSHACGNILPKEHPTVFRTPLDYFEIIQKSEANNSGFQLLCAKNMLTYIQHYANPNQLCFLATKTTPRGNILPMSPPDNFDLFSKDKEFVKSLISKLEINSSHRVLNLNCGNRGSTSFSIVELSSAFVHAVDSSPANLHRAISQQSKVEPELRKKIQFSFSRSVADIRLELETFDRVLFLAKWNEKMSNLNSIRSDIQSIKNYLKPGGKMLFSCFVSGQTATEKPSRAEDCPTFPQLENVLKNKGLTVIKLKRTNSTISSLWQNFLSSEEGKSLKDSNSDGFKQVENRISNLRDGKLDWVIVTASK